MPDYFPDFENHVGKLIPNELLKYACEGKFKNEEELAGHLDNTIEKDVRKVQGNFRYRKKRNDFVPGEEAMKDILSRLVSNYI